MDLTMLMLMGGGRIDPIRLNQMVTSGNERRRKLFVKAADLLFGLVMLIFGKLTFKDSAGNVIDPTKISAQSDSSADTKLNMILLALQNTTQGTLFREFLRPFIIDAAEMLAAMMEPDPLVLSMMSNGGLMGQSMTSVPNSGGGSTYIGPPALPPVGSQQPYVPAPPAQSVGSQYEGWLIQAPGDVKVYHVVGGHKNWVVNPHAFDSRGYKWDNVHKNFPANVLMSIPDGPAEA